MPHLRINTSGVHFVLSIKTDKYISVSKRVLCQYTRNRSRTAVKPVVSKLRLIEASVSPGRRYALREIESDAYSCGRPPSSLAVVKAFIRKIFSPLLAQIEWKQVASMYADQSLLPPEAVRGMKTLDVGAFKKIVYVPGLRVPNRSVGIAVGGLKHLMLKMPGVKAIAEVKESDPEHESHKLFLFDPDKVKNIELLGKEHEDIFAKCNINKDSIQLYELELGYRNWTHQEVLRAILPKEYDGVAGFSSIGHILHLNLRNEIMDYKYIIGKVLLDKIPTARTVVNKLDIIDTTFRNFEMEVLAGDDDFVAVTKENGLSYKLDFSKVYWNPRLGTEHQRILSLLQSHDVVWDVFAGIGPFAVPAAKKGCTVYANDLNPHSYHWLRENMTLNKVKADHWTYNLDGRDFIKTVVRDKLAYHWSQETVAEKAPQYHIIMNLPAIAVEFLDAFHGLFSEYSAGDRKTWPSYSEPWIYCYAFSKEPDGKKDAEEQAEKYLGAPLGTEHQVRFVRQVAPNKDMFCITFKPSRELLFDDSTVHHKRDVEPPAKKQKSEPGAS